jgi:hypothetical protein
MPIKYVSLIIVTLCLLAACKPSSIHTTREYQSWLNQSENQCKVSKKVGDMLISVKYLPVNFLALKEYEQSDKKLSYDSLLNVYRHSVTFIMTFETTKKQEGEDVMYKDLSNYKEYVERSLTLNFDLESKVQLKGNFGSCYPVLSSMENTYGLSKGRDVCLVFSSKEAAYDLMEEPYWDLVYEDDIYHTGILHFTFNYPELSKKLPLITLQ